ncbi:MAG TPA: hypothetical protein VFA74_16785 [Terriglobales bacterium]|nr:hypothetical protein [Terriglobales bacterium]
MNPVLGTQITSLAALALALSVAVERVIEILKGMIPILATPQTNPKLENLRGAVIHLLSVAIGAIAARGGGIDLFQKITGVASANNEIRWLSGYLICGLMTAGGSAFWNHILDIVQASKIKNETAAKQEVELAGNVHPIAA